LASKLVNTTSADLRMWRIRRYGSSLNTESERVTMLSPVSAMVRRSDVITVL